VHITPRFAHRPQRIADFHSVLIPANPDQSRPRQPGEFANMQSENRTPDRDQPSSRISEGWLRQGVALIQVAGALDPLSGARLIRLLDRHTDGPPWAIVLDLREVTVLESDVVPSLEHIAYQAGDADIGLYVVAAEGVCQSLTAAGVEALFDIYPTVEATVKALTGGDQPRCPGDQ
jgi:anti-anti-sigma regulatory factor